MVGGVELRSVTAADRYFAAIPGLLDGVDAPNLNGGSDFRSIEADNTSAFSCRNATDTSSWSNHAYGLAIDLNPIENPYETRGSSSHRASRPYLARSRHLRGKIHHGDAVWRAFAAVGWHWGGDYAGSIKDYQHFSPTGR